ncbi:MAG: SpaA isopeptide-forming pilin-related protein [Bilifractor sp.]
MRKKILSIVLAAGMVFGMVPGTVMADTAVQSASSAAAEQTEEEKTIEAAEKAALDFAALPKETVEDGKTSRLIVSAESGSFDEKSLGTKDYVSYDGLIVAQYDSVKTAESYKTKLESQDGVDAVEYDQAMVLSDDTAFTADPEDSAITSDSADTSGSSSAATDSASDAVPASQEQGTESVSVFSQSAKSDSKYLFEQADADGKKIIAVIDSGAPESLVKKQSWLIDETDENYKKETGEDRNGHGTEMVQIISNLAQDSSYIYSIKAFDKDGNGCLSSVLMALKLAKAEQADLINISANTKTKSDSDILQAVIADAAEKSQIVVSAGNNADDASGYLPAGMESVTAAGAANADGYLTDTSNYGSSVNYYVTTDSTSKAAATVTGYLSAGNTFGDNVKTSAEKKPAAETESTSASSEQPENAVSSSSTQSEENETSNSSTHLFSGAHHAPKLNADSSSTSNSDDRVITAEFMDTPNKSILKKMDQDGKLLDGGEFTFTDPNGNKIVKTTATGTDIDASMQGAVVLEGLIPGTWTYQETKAPKGYQIDNNIYKFTVMRDGLINGQTEYTTTIYNITNLPNNWWIRIFKRDSLGRPVKGIVFEINDGNETYSVTTDDSGLAKTKTYLQGETVTIKYHEVSVPADSGIILDKTEHTVQAKDGKILSERRDPQDRPESRNMAFPRADGQERQRCLRNQPDPLHHGQSGWKAVPGRRHGGKTEPERDRAERKGAGRNCQDPEDQGGNRQPG